MTAYDSAAALTARGWRVVPVPFRTKAPILRGWPDLRLDIADLAAHFNGQPSNIGLLLGDPSGGLTDIDLDVREASDLADLFLPKTASEFGRASKPRSHRLYVADPLVETEQFADVEKTGPEEQTAMIVELRSTKAQTVAPGSTHEGGEAIEFNADGDPARVDGEALLTAVRHLAVAALLARHWPAKGARHETVLAAAGLLLRASLDVADVTRILTAAARYVDPSADLRIVRSDVAGTARKLQDGEDVTGGPRLAELLAGDGVKVVARLRAWLGVTETGAHLTDAGNAERFAGDHGADVRYCYARRSWFVWSETRWRRDDGDLVAGRAKTTARHLWAEAAAAPTEERRKALAKWATYSESEPGIRRMLELAKSEPGIPVTLDQLDRDPWLLNTPSGTLELRTGHLRPHRREDLITKITAAPYAPDARHPVFDAFLERVLPDEDVRAFVQRAAGYALTASTREEKLFIAHGPTAGGKSTLLTALRRAMGDYATTADAQTFMERRVEGGAPRDDLVKLVGRRLVVSSEVKDGSRMAESLVKTLFGGDDMSARALYERTIEFSPQFKVMIAANHRPQARDDDDALWRRILEIPFVVSIPETERDPAVKTTLCDPGQAGAAILAWAVEGCTAWLADGLGAPDAVRKATKAYRDAMDPLSDFLTDRCVLEAFAIVTASDLRTAYETWAKANGVRFPLGARAMAERLGARGCDAYKQTGGTRAWMGIRLRTDADPDPSEPPGGPASGQESPRDSTPGGPASGASGASGAQVREPPYTRAHEESSEQRATDATGATGDPCSGCHEVGSRARLTEHEGALWCPSCLHAKSSYRAMARTGDHP